MNPATARLEDQLQQVEQDLVDLEGQEAAGEIDSATADRLRGTYRAEVARLRTALESPPREPGAEGRSRARMIAGGAVLLLGAIVIVAAAVTTLGDRVPGGNLTGGIASDVAAGGGVDLENVSNEEMEAVVAANPDVVPMRLALARRYFEALDYGKALDHYMVVLDDQGVQSSEALANVGWMTAVSGRPDVGITFVERALEVETDYPQAYWYLGNIALALEERQRAEHALATLLEYSNLPAEIAGEAESILEDLRARP